MFVAFARRLVPISLLALMMLAFSPDPASAHAVLADTAPGNWQVVESSPHEISLRFNEPVDAGLAEIRLLGPRGDTVEGLPRPTHPDGKQDVLSIAVADTLATGTHTVAYRVVSADSHPVQGAFTFSVGAPTSSVPGSVILDEGSAATAVVYGTSRWMGYAGLALLLGTAYFIVVCWPGGVARTGAVRSLLWSGWAAVLTAALVGLLVYGPYAAGKPLTAVFDVGLLGSTLGSRMGLMLAARVVLLAVLAVALARTRGRWVLAVGGVLPVTWGLATHSAAGDHVGIALVADFVHLAAMSVWIGGLPVLLVVLLRSGDILGMRSAIPRFSRTAAVCVALLVVTGIFQAWRQVGTPDALFGTAYGTVLLVKVVLVVVLVGLGWFARRWVEKHYGAPIVTVTDKRRARRGPDSGELRRFRRSVAVEAGIAALVLGLTASLVSVEPARGELAKHEAAARVPAFTGPVSMVIPFDAGGIAGRGELAVELSPGKIGANEAHLVVLDTESLPRDVPEVRAELRLRERSLGPLPVALQYGGVGHHIATAATITMPGQWELDVTVRTSETDQTTVRVPIGIR
jgi:copper transport protein